VIASADWGRDLAARLFGPLPVIVEHAELGAEPPPIHPAEAAEVAATVHRRQVEYATGRHCAHRALARLNLHGVRDFVLRNDGSRAPRWPPGVVGSITHTGAVPGGACAVAVASTRDIVALGLDAEAGDLLREGLWPELLTPAEARGLSGLPEPRRARLVRLTFSAKECFYKAQFPLTRRFIGFHEVEIAIDEACGTFAVRALDPATAQPPLLGCRGRYIDSADLVVTGIAIPA
jgi:4'-phosphopantetheinyl transferase EntD